MKFLMPSLACVVLLSVVGCTQLDNALLREDIREEITVQTNQVAQILPNGLIFTNVFVSVSTNYYTNYVANPDAQAVITGTQAIPIYGGLISAIGTTLLGFYRAFRNRQIAVSAVQSIHAGRRALVRHGNGGEKVFLDAVVEEQERLGMREPIRKIVKRSIRRR